MQSEKEESKTISTEEQDSGKEEEAKMVPTEEQDSRQEEESKMVPSGEQDSKEILSDEEQERLNLKLFDLFYFNLFAFGDEPIYSDEGSLEQARELVSRGADVNYNDDILDTFVLIVAVKQNLKKCVEFLIRKN